MTDREDRLAPVDHATLDEVMERLREARSELGYWDKHELRSEPAREPNRESVLMADDEIARAIEGLARVQEAHAHEDDKRARAAAIRASETAELDQWQAQDRERGL